MNTKYKIAQIISNSYCWIENPTYEDLIESIYENQYRTINKIPTEIMLLGTVQSFIINDIEQAKRIFNLTKQVIIESLEFSGIEVTFTDDDWDKLDIILNPSKWGGKHILTIDGTTKYKKKSYLSEFFEY